ncbi:MAG: hypothetical protein LBU34_03270 [Planctomycetaceae bacterium]|nr:hypothetical protein [Planctomycetaceae bacterium]
MCITDSCVSFHRRLCTTHAGLRFNVNTENKSQNRYKLNSMPTICSLLLLFLAFVVSVFSANHNPLDKEVLKCSTFGCS